MHAHPARHAIAAAATFSLLSFPLSPSAAEETPVVVITATRFAEQSAVAPIGLDILSAADIERSTATSLAEVLAKLGGVQTRINFYGLPDAPLDLRGFGVSGDQNTAVLINGVRISEDEQAAARISTIPLNAVERIEIQRSSGAVLYGAGATGGVINIITRAALAQPPTGRLAATLGSYGNHELRGNVAAGTGSFGLALSASRIESDGYRRNSASSADNANGEVRFTGDDGWLALRLNADRQRARTPGIRTELQLSNDRRGTGNPRDYAHMDGSQATLSGEYRLLPAITLSADIGRREKNARFYSESGFGSVLNNTRVSVTTWSPRFRWQETLGSLGNQLIIGGDWSDWDYRTRWNATGFFLSRDEIGTQRNAALYLQDQLQLTPALRVSLGLRNERIKQGSREMLTPLPNSARTHDLNAHELAVRYDLDASTALYARSGRSYRLANVDDNRCFFPPCPSDLEPQTSRDREVGVEWQQRGAHARAALFSTRIRNEIYYNNLTFANMNLSPTRREGLELAGGFSPVPGWEVDGHYFHTRAHFIEGNYGGVDVSGKTVPLVPQQRAVLSVGWQAAAATRVTANATWVGRQRYDNDPANRFHDMPSYTLVDLKLAQQMGAMKLTAGISNLFDKRYYSYALVNSSFAPTTFSGYPEMPRTAYVGAEYAW